MDLIPLHYLFMALLALLALSAFFSGSETALMTLNRYRLRHLAQQGHRGASRAELLLRRPDRLIGFILLGNSFANIMASSLATIIAMRLGGESLIPLAAGLLTLILLVFSEVAPKTLAAFNPERVAYPSALIIVPLLRLTYPLVWVINSIANLLLRRMGVNADCIPQHSISPEELRTLVSETHGLIPHHYRSMMLGVLDLATTMVEDIMIPRNEVEAINIDDPAEQLLAQLKSCHYARLPVYSGTIDNAIGVVEALKGMNALLDNDLDKQALREAIREPYFIPKGVPLNVQLRHFQEKKRRIGLVVDEYGDFQGIVSLFDLLELIVGEFTQTPWTPNREIQHQPDGRVVIDGGIWVRDLNRLLDWDLPTDGPKTLNGLILEYLETIPEPGTSLKLHGHALEILHIADNFVKSVRWDPLESPATDRTGRENNLN